MADVYRKVGRGGAGNFYSQKDVEEASDNAESSRDLEAQKLTAPVNEAPTDPAEAPPAAAAAAADPSAASVRSTGRGGAGNHVDPRTASSSNIISGAKPHPATVHSTGNPNGQQPRLSGRGGAGNYTSGGGDEKKVGVDEEQERKRKEALDKGIFDDVRASLREPGRAHTRVHPHGRGGGPGGGLEES